MPLHTESLEPIISSSPVPFYAKANILTVYIVELNTKY